MTTPRKTRDIRAWSARLAVSAVFVINVQAALGFIIWPERYIGGFELAGIPGDTAHCSASYSCSS